MAYPNLSDSELLKIKTKDDQLKELQKKTKKHDQENLLKSPKVDDEFMRSIKNLNKRKFCFLSLEYWLGRLQLLVLQQWV